MSNQHKLKAVSWSSPACVCEHPSLINQWDVPAGGGFKAALGEAAAGGGSASKGLVTARVLKDTKGE